MSTAPALIAQVREMVRTRLAADFSAALAALPQDLHALGARSQSLGEHRILGEAVAKLESCKGPLAAGFEREMLALFDAKCARRAGASSSAAELSLDQLTLVDDAHMEQQIALGHLVRKTRFELDADQVFGIETRIGELVAGARLEGDADPVGPEAVFEALRRACEAVPADGAVRTALMNGLQPHIARALKVLYGELNELLARQGIVPKIRRTVEKSIDAPAGAGGGRGAHAGGGGGEAHSGGAGEGVRITEGERAMINRAMELRELLPLSASAPIDLGAIIAAYLQGPPEARQYGARMLADQDGALYAHAMETPVDPRLLTKLSMLQSAVTGRDTGDLMAVLEHLARMHAHPIDQLTGELVAVVFEHLLQDPDIADPAKEEIARLQIVAFKAALLDRSFFARREHPLRELLTAIADAASDPQIDASADGHFVKYLHTVIDEVLARFTNDLSVFEMARDGIAGFITEVRRENEIEVKSLAAMLAERERVAEARAFAEAEIAKRAGPSAPAFVRQFLNHVWVRVVAAVAEHNPTDNVSWDAPLQLVDDLLWSVQPKSATDVPRLTAMLPKLIAGLSRGMQSVDTEPDVQQAFLNELMRVHTALLQAAKAHRGASPPPQSPPHPAVPTPSVAPAQPAKETIDAPELNAETLPPLERGAVIEFSDVDPPVRATLAWVSPKRGMYVFLSAGSDTRQMTAQALAEALHEETARIIVAGSAIVERALGAIAGEDASGGS